MTGIKETKELMSFFTKLCNAIGHSLVDGKIDFTDVSQFMAPLMTSGEAFKDAGLIKTELKDLDEVEKAELIQHLKDELKLPQASVEKLLESGFAAMGHIYNAVQEILKALPPKQDPKKDDIVKAVLEK